MKATFVELPAFERHRGSYLSGSDESSKWHLRRSLQRGGWMARKLSTGGKSATRRDVFSEIMEGVSALGAARSGKRTLRTHTVVLRPVPGVTPSELVRLRARLNLSRGVFAAYLRTNVRTLENWEQGRARPNAQAALLIHLVKHYPDTVERLASL
jgi:putative transcriptional regulator